MKHQIEELIQALQDDNWRVRQSAVWALGEIRPDAKQVVFPIIQALQDDQNQQVRIPVVEALTKIGTPEAIKAAVPALIQALQDKNVRIVAALALEKIGTPEALEAIKNLDK